MLALWCYSPINGAAEFLRYCLAGRLLRDYKCSPPDPERGAPAIRFQGSSANVVLEKSELVLSAEDETKLRNMNDILQQKLSCGAEFH